MMVLKQELRYLQEAVTIPTITVIGGNHTDEDSTVTFNKAVTSSSGITLDDNTGDAKLSLRKIIP